MTLQELITYCQREGVSHTLVPRGDLNTLRVLDLSQLSMAVRAYFDVESGYYNRPLVVTEEPIPEPADSVERLAESLADFERKIGDAAAPQPAAKEAEMKDQHPSGEPSDEKPKGKKKK